jgi:hypothetical protein
VVNNKVFFGMNNDDFFEVIVEEGCIISIEWSWVDNRII